RVARASTVVWTSIAMSMALAAGAVTAQAPAPGDASGASDAALPRPTRMHNALRSALDCYRRGDYELAATYLQQAQAGQDELTANERETLKNYRQLNSAALEARREGTKQLRLAEKAVREHRTQDAVALLKSVMPNQQFLKAPEKQRFGQLSEQVMPGSTGSTG